MKASLKVRDGNENPLFRAKIPLAVFGLPFTSSVIAGDPSDLSFHLRSALSAGPSLRLSYSPNDHPNNSFSFSLKSGTGLWGSPEDSPLVFSAQFSLLGRLNPSFSLQIRPHLGDFSIKKTARSIPHPNPNLNPIKENGVTHVPLAMDLPTDIRHVSGGFFSGIALTAKTLLPVTKNLELNFRWGLNFPSEFGLRNLPFLKVDKICIRHFEKKNATRKEDGPVATPLKTKSEVCDLDVLKGMCSWMGREMEALQVENRMMKENIEEIKRSGIQSNGRYPVAVHPPTRRPPEVKVDSAEFERWNRKKQNEGASSGRRDSKPDGSPEASGNEVEEELKKAIKAASS